MRFRGLQAAVWAGATLDDLYKWENNEYPSTFMSTIVALYNSDNLVSAHIEDEKAKKMDRKK